LAQRQKSHLHCQSSLRSSPGPPLDPGPAGSSSSPACSQLSSRSVAKHACARKYFRAGGAGAALASATPPTSATTAARPASAFGGPRGRQNARPQAGELGHLIVGQAAEEAPLHHLPVQALELGHQVAAHRGDRRVDDARVAGAGSPLEQAPPLELPHQARDPRRAQARALGELGHAQVALVRAGDRAQGVEGAQRDAELRRELRVERLRYEGVRLQEAPPSGLLVGAQALLGGPPARVLLVLRPRGHCLPGQENSRPIGRRQGFWSYSGGWRSTPIRKRSMARTSTSATIVKASAITSPKVAGGQKNEPLAVRVSARITRHQKTPRSRMPRRTSGLTAPSRVARRRSAPP